MTLGKWGDVPQEHTTSTFRVHEYCHTLKMQAEYYSETLTHIYQNTAITIERRQPQTPSCNNSTLTQVMVASFQFIVHLTQECTNPGRQVAMATTFCKVAPNMCGSSI